MKNNQDNQKVNTTLKRQRSIIDNFLKKVESKSIIKDSNESTTKTTTSLRPIRSIHPASSLRRKLPESFPTT